MANLSLYYPNPIVAGSTAGTYADGARAALKDLSNTFTQNQVFSGTNSTAPNQTAASGSSLMTRDLIDQRIWQTLTPSGFSVSPSAFQYLSANSGAAGVNGHNARVNTSTTVLSSVAWMNILTQVAGASINTSNSGAGGASLSYVRPWVFTFQMSRPFWGASTSTRIYFKITNAAAGTAPTYTVPASEVCCGIMIYGNSSNGLMPNFQAFRSDGTTLTTTTALTNPNVDDTFPIRVYCDGTNVTFSFYKIGTGWVTIGTVARPNMGGNFQFQASAINDGITASRADFAVIGNPTFMNLDTLA